VLTSLSKTILSLEVKIDHTIQNVYIHNYRFVSSGINPTNIKFNKQRLQNVLQMQPTHKKVVLVRII